MKHADSTPPPAPALNESLLAYDSLAPVDSGGARPWWTYAVIAVYVALLVAFLTLPAWAQWVLGAGGSDAKVLGGSIAVLATCGLALMVIPVQTLRRRPVTRRSIWIPIIASGFLSGVLVLGGGLAVVEYLAATGEAAPRMVLIAAVATWVVWSALFMLIAFSSRQESVGKTLHRRLIAGSVLELLIAVPTHVIVRRRQECCAGYLTGLGICLGVAVMLVSLGPSVLLLYYRRRKQITPRHATRDLAGPAPEQVR